MIRIPEDLDNELRELRQYGYLPAVLIRQALAEMVERKLAEAQRREKWNLIFEKQSKH